MRTIELTLATVGSALLYFTYCYYLFEYKNDVKPTNLWFTLGSMIDEFLFNSGIKPKQQIQNAPNRIIQWINENSD